MPLECIAWLGLNSLLEFEGAEGVAVSAMPLCIPWPHIHNRTLCTQTPTLSRTSSLHASVNSELKFNPPFHLGLKNTNACKLANFVLSLADQCAAHLPLPPTHAKMEKCLLPAQNPFLSSFIVFLLLFRSLFGFVFYFFFCTLHIFLICNLRTLLIFSILFVFLFVSFIIFLFLWQPSKTLRNSATPSRVFPSLCAVLSALTLSCPKCWKIKIGANGIAKFIFIGMPIKCAPNW